MTHVVQPIRLCSASNEAKPLEGRREPGVMLGFAHRRPGVLNALTRTELRVFPKHYVIDPVQLSCGRTDKFGLFCEHRYWPISIQAGRTRRHGRWPGDGSGSVRPQGGNLCFEGGNAISGPPHLSHPLSVGAPWHRHQAQSASAAAARPLCVGHVDPTGGVTRARSGNGLFARRMSRLAALRSREWGAGPQLVARMAERLGCWNSEIVSLKHIQPARIRWDPRGAPWWHPPRPWQGGQHGGASKKTCRASWCQGTSRVFSSVDPAGTWALRPGRVAAAAVRQGAVALALPRAEVAVQLRAVAEALHAEAVVVALLRRAAATQVELPGRAEAAMVVELPRRAEAALVELPGRAEAGEVESSRRAEVAYVPQWLEACLREALKRCRTADCRRRSPGRHAVAHREAHDRPEESRCCYWCRFSYRRHQYPRCPVTARQEASDCQEASRYWLRERLLRP